MLQNAVEFEPGALVEADTCIIGSGPAGLAAAMELDRRGKSCVILETGGRDYDDRHQSVGHLDSSYSFGNLKDRQLDERRQIGGKSNAWSIETDTGVRGVRLLPYAEANFAARPAMGGLAWPFDRSALDPYYKKAADFFEISSDEWLYPQGQTPPLASPDLVPVRFRFSDGEVLTRHVNDVVGPSERIRLISNATALRLAIDPATNAVSEVRCESEPGRPFTVKARQVVVAGGALSTTALLLRSDDVIPGGIGNHSGLLGRYFMDHPLIDGGELLVTDPETFAKAAAYDLRTDNNASEMAHLQLRQDTIRNEPVANINAMLYPRTRVRNLSQAKQDARRAAQEAWRVLKDPRSSLTANINATISLGFHVGEVVNHYLSQKDERNARINRGGWSREAAADRFRSFQVLHISEQPPRIENRVLLGEERDRFGQRRATINWKLAPEDSQAIRRAQELYADSFRKGGWGEYRLLEVNGGPELVHSSLGHHIGTTRMHADARQGVTDAAGRVHGVANLFIASSSLFPTGGWENPTLTIVALAIRIADHIAAFA